MVRRVYEKEVENGISFEEEWEEVDEFNADGSLVRISDLAALTNPRWIDPNDPCICTVALKFQYLMDARLSAALPDS